MNLEYNQRVKFIEETHTYLLDNEVILSGITSIISNKLFPDKYKGIPDHILQNAADYGTMIHSKCQAHNLFEVCDCVEIENYEKIKIDNNLIYLEDEYLVSDNKHVATLIDNVFKASDNSVHLVDIKTTYILDKEYLSWQLSICAYLFELQNPHIKVDKLFGLRLRQKESSLVEVVRIDDSIIKQLIYSHVNNTYFDNPILDKLERLPEVAKIKQLEQAIVNLESEAKRLKEQQDEYKTTLLKQMEESGVDKWETDNLVFTRVAPTESKVIDTSRIKKELPEIADKYIKTNKVKGYLKIKLK